MSSASQLLSTRAKVIGLGLLVASGMLGVAVSRRGTSVDPLERERLRKAVASSASAPDTAPAPEQDFSDKRWKQRAEERAVMQDAAPSQRPAPGAAGRALRAERDGAGQAPGHAQADAPSSGRGTLGAAQTLEAGLHAEPNGSRGSSNGGVNTWRAQTGAAAATTATPGASRGSSGSSSPSPVLPGAPGAALVGCGDGVLQTGELCEPAGSPKCGDDCTPVVSDACYNCELNTRCVAIASACTDFMTSKLDESLCYDVAHCIQDTGCAAGERTLTSCFCGDMTTEQCVSAPDGGDKAPHGACADVIRDAMGLGVSNAYVLTHYTTRSVPAGAAIMRFQCLKNDATCAPICFVK